MNEVNVASPIERVVIWWKCKVRFKHDYKKPFEVTDSVRLVECKRCKNRYAMSDEHKAFLRYDNDKAFKEDLKCLYPKLEGLDI